jgi:hypothetical protein
MARHRRMADSFKPRIRIDGVHRYQRYSWTQKDQIAYPGAETYRMTKQNVQKYHIIIISEVHNIKTTKNCSRFSKKQLLANC